MKPVRVLQGRDGDRRDDNLERIGARLDPKELQRLPRLVDELVSERHEPRRAHDQGRRGHGERRVRNVEGETPRRGGMHVHGFPRAHGERERRPVPAPEPWRALEAELVFDVLEVGVGGSIRGEERDAAVLHHLHQGSWLRFRIWGLEFRASGFVFRAYFTRDGLDGGDAV